MSIAQKMIEIAQHRAELSRQIDGASPAERDYLVDKMAEDLDRLMILDDKLKTLVKYTHHAEDAKIIANKVLESHNVRTGYDMAQQLNALAAATLEVVNLLEIAYEEYDREVCR